MCSAENYRIVGSCTPNFRRLRWSRSRSRAVEAPFPDKAHGFLPTYWDFESLVFLFSLRTYYNYKLALPRSYLYLASTFFSI